MVNVEHNASAEMRDGTVLRADVYRPANAGASPVLLCRTPYDKAADAITNTARELASKGYVAVVHATLLLPMIVLGQVFLWGQHLSLGSLSRGGRKLSGQTRDDGASSLAPMGAPQQPHHEPAEGA